MRMVQMNGFKITVKMTNIKGSDSVLSCFILNFWIFWTCVCVVRCVCMQVEWMMSGDSIRLIDRIVQCQEAQGWHLIRSCRRLVRVQINKEIYHSAAQAALVMIFWDWPVFTIRTLSKHVERILVDQLNCYFFHFLHRDGCLRSSIHETISIHQKSSSAHVNGYLSSQSR